MRNSWSLWILAVIVIGLVMAISRIWNERRARKLASLAARWNGKVDKAGVFTIPDVSLSVEAVPGLISFFRGERTRSPWTKVQFNHEFRQRLRLTPERRVTMWHSLARSSEVQVGDPEFDADHWIESSDESWARFVLSPVVRREILRLRREAVWFSVNEVTLDLGVTGLTLKVSCLLADDVRDLERFVDLAILILREALGKPDAASVLTDALETLPGSECPVCGHGVQQAKNCPKCRTPHHDDCWKYSGGCAIFACSSRARAGRVA